MPRLRKKPKPITEKQRTIDDELREKLRKADLKKFDRALERVIRPTSR